MGDAIPLIHVFIDHSKVWGDARAAYRIHHPKINDARARIRVKNLDRLLINKRKGVTTKIVSGAVPPGLEGMWMEYQKAGYATQRLFRDAHWREHGVGHSLIGHMWRLIARHQASPTVLVLASGDGRSNEFGPSFIEVVQDILTHSKYESWNVEFASFEWPYEDGKTPLASPTNQRMKQSSRRIHGGPS